MKYSESIANADVTDVTLLVIVSYLTVAAGCLSIYGVLYSRISIAQTPLGP